MRIIGIDPGVATIGFGLIEADRAKVQLLRYGVITTPAGLPLSVRLRQISEDMVELLGQFKPEEMAVEELFSPRTSPPASPWPTGGGSSCWRRSGPASRPSSTPPCRSSRPWPDTAARIKNRSCS